MLNMDFSQAVFINCNKQPWQPSPAAGVNRKPLARENKESGHATSIVRYDAGASFATHHHPKGEEILVLEGVFSDESGDYPAGSYLRNPPGSSHAPFSKEGCTLLVKLHQFAEGDQQSVRIDSHQAAWQPGPGKPQMMLLHEYQSECTALVKLPAGEQLEWHNYNVGNTVGNNGGEEILVLSGVLADEHGRYPALSWLRYPHQSEHQPYAEDDTLLWIKVGHLTPA